MIIGKRDLLPDQVIQSQIGGTLMVESGGGINQIIITQKVTGIIIRITLHTRHVKIYTSNLEEVKL